MEDVDENNGPLMYYPGSHRWPVYTNEHIGQCSADRDPVGQVKFLHPWPGQIPLGRTASIVG